MKHLYKNFFKYVVDFVISLIGIILLLPIFAIITIILFFSNNGKPFFLHTRPGKNGKLFKVIKFKTMNDKKDKLGNFLPDEKRVTKVGNFVRRASLDELPQLLNVLKGDMSLIGPRPLMVEYLLLYDEEQQKRHEARPGISGWAQVNGRNSLSWDEKFKLDVYYVNHCSLILDIKIIYLTFIKVFKREGVHLIQPFKGNTIK